jgi:hypothetical protein
MADRLLVAEGMWATDREIALASKHMLRALLSLPAVPMRDEAVMRLRQAQACATMAATEQLKHPEEGYVDSEQRAQRVIEWAPRQQPELAQDDANAAE